jgi:hypothetical protein
MSHLQSARQFLRNGTRSSILAIHLAQIWQRSSNSIPSAGMLRDELSCSILWQSDPFSCSKCLVNFLVSCVRRRGLRWTPVSELLILNFIMKEKTGLENRS